ncbi:ribosomal protein L2 [Fomitiporia mediterranea MF3/22]|uniref:ribosomal protein L2 n=1 Tax=Fomitiporia mediterranea (strain MF3/22) TaxID=694068 RepID=UPI0004409917|nr:ribosomal protein L2 [Fomitiporia mediterranea MF3/22]EJD03521.1 ribosomal protein L2 [Fomitiporia mediterranea MF3/22]
MFSAARAGVQLLRTHSASSTSLSRIAGLKRHYAAETQPSNINEALARTSALFKTYKPVTPGIRHLRRPLNDHLWAGRPIKALTIPLRKKGGRNNQGRITIRHRGGGHKRRLRTVDFMRADGGPQDVIRIEYDPGRSGHIALIRGRDANANGGMRYCYILAPEGLRAGDVVQSFRNGIPKGTVPGFDGNLNASFAIQEDGTTSKQTTTQSLTIGLLRAATVRTGNVLPLKLIPPGTPIHCISLFPDRRMTLVRSAGTSATVVTHEEDGRYTQVKLQSGEVRKVLQSCCATIGKVSNPLHRYRSLGKAGRKRWLGRRPHVRGTAMNRVDHPHGGGRGKSKGNKHPRSIWGWLTKGKRTRRPGPKGPKGSNKMVIKERPRGKEKRQ